MAERYRQHIGPERVQVGLPDSGGVDLATQLSRAAKEVAGAAYSTGAALVEQQGIEQGQQAGLTGTPDPRTGMSALTPFGRGYNSAAEAAYSAKIQTDIQTTIERLALDREADPAGLQFAIDSYGAAIHDSVPEAYRPQVAVMLKGKTAVAVARAQAQLKIREGNQIVASHLEGMDSALKMAVEGATKLPGREGDAYAIGFAIENRRRLEVMAREGLIQPTDVVKYDGMFRDALEKGLTDAPVNAAIEDLTDLIREDVEVGAAALEQLWKRDDLTDEQKLAVQKGAEAVFSDVHSTRSRLYAEDIAALDKRLASEESSVGIENEARRLFRLGALTQEGFSSRLSGNVRNAKANAEKADDMAAVRAALASGQGLDPTDPDAKKAVDTLFQARAGEEGLLPGSRQWQELAIETFRQSNILPATVLSWGRISALSQDPATVALGAEFLAKAWAANPTAAQYTAEDSRLQSLVWQVHEGIASGAPVEEAVGLAHRNAEQANNKALRDELERRYAKDKVQEGNSLALRGFLNSGSKFDRSPWYRIGGGAPATPPEMDAEFNARVKANFMLNGGDKQAAREQAAEQVMSTYRYTTINGKPEIMKWGIDPSKDEVVRQDLNTALDAKGFTGDKTKLKLVPNTETERSRGVFWSVVPEDENGFVFDVVRGPDNRPLLYSIPNADRYKKARDELRSKRLQDEEATRQEQERTREIMRQYQSPIPVGAP
jgi:hypothetical protein